MRWRDRVALAVSLSVLLALVFRVAGPGSLTLPSRQPQQAATTVVREGENAKEDEKAIATADSMAATPPEAAPEAQQLVSVKEEAYLAICVEVRDDIDIFEWILYHVEHGVQKILVYDHGSTPPFRSLLQRWIDQNIVEYKYVTYPLSHIFGGDPQAKIYGECLEEGKKGRFHWMAFLESDEYLVSPQTTHPAASTGPSSSSFPFHDVLREFEAYPGILLARKLVSSSGHIRRPATPVTRTYTQCVGDRRFRASIVQPRLTKRVSQGNADYFVHLGGRKPVDENLIFVTAPLTSPPEATFRKVWVHQYIGSKEDYKRKVRAYRGILSMDTFFSVDIAATSQCPQLTCQTCL
jgi:hypothetical protein